MTPDAARAEPRLLGRKPNNERTHERGLAQFASD